MSDGWDRVAVFGSTGAGKSTLARRLARRLSAEHVELDALCFDPGWQPRPEQAFRDDVEAAVRDERWIIDGNYRVVRDLVWGRATLLVWLDYGLATCLARATRRCVRRAWTRELVCGENRESFRQTFASRDSLLLYLVQTHANRRRETERDLREPARSAKPFVRHRSPRQADAWIEGIESGRGLTPR